MPEINEEQIKGLLEEMRGTTPEAKLREGLEAIIKDDAEKEEKAKNNPEIKFIEKDKIEELDKDIFEVIV